MIVRLIFSFMVLVLFGFSIIRILLKDIKFPFIVMLALAYLFGQGILCQWILILGILKIPFSVLMTTYLMMFVAIILLYFSNKRNSFKKKILKEFVDDEGSGHKYIIGIFLLFIFSSVFYIFWRSFNVPISTWDAFSTHSFNGKIFFFERSLKYLRNMPHFSYPLHLPFMKMWICLNLGEWDDQLIKFFIPFNCAVYLIFQYYFIRHFCSKKYSIFSLVLVLSSAFFVFHSVILYRDFTMSVYNCVTILLIILWNVYKKDNLLVLSALFSGFTSFIKLEGTGYVFIHAVLVATLLFLLKEFSIKKKFLKFLKFILPSVGIAFIYHMYKFVFIRDEVSSGAKAFTLHLTLSHFDIKTFQTLTSVIGEYLNNMFLTSNWGFIWPLFLVSLYFLKRCKYVFEVKILIFSICLFFVIYIAGFSFTQHHVWIINNDQALSRSMLQFFPLIAVAIAMINYSDKKRQG